MENESLPPDLARLERDLTERPFAGPTAEFRSRILREVRSGLRRPGPLPWLPFAAEAAAAALLWINVSWSVVRSADPGSWAGVEIGPVASESQRIRELVPELSAREATRAAMMLHAATDLDRCRQFPLGLVASRRVGDDARSTR